MFQQNLVSPGTTVLGFCSDPKKSSFWGFTSAGIKEIVVTDEERDLWRILLKDGSLEEAMRFAEKNLGMIKSPSSKVATE